jgi:hypothetical protein
MDENEKALNSSELSAFDRVCGIFKKYRHI